MSRSYSLHVVQYGYKEKMMIDYVRSACLILLVLYLRRVILRFRDYGVRFRRPLPVLGNMAPIVFCTKHFMDHITELYKSFSGDRFFGRFEYMKPVIFVRDLELVKKIMLDDVESFLDHRQMFMKGTDPLLERIMFVLKGQEWKEMRATLNPMFSDSKIKQILPSMMEIGARVTSSLVEEIEDSETQSIEIDAKELMIRFANDVLASCVFGKKVNSIKEPDNEFFRKGYIALKFGTLYMLKTLAFFLFRPFMKILNIKLLSRETRIYFKHLVFDPTDQREEDQIYQPRMIQTLVDIKKGQLSRKSVSGSGDPGSEAVGECPFMKKMVTVNREWSDSDLVAQSLIFFLAGLEPSGAALTFLLYELAVNPHVQDKLYEEIKAHVKANKGTNHDSINQMVYMNMVVLELLRLWPPSIVLDRVCTADYNLGKPHANAKKDYIIKVGENIAIPICAIHRDPKYFPDPDKFNPERFSEENIHKIQPFAYIPFGIGPRSCIGNLFVLQEMKVLLYQLLQHIEVLPCKKTKIPAKLSPQGFNLSMLGGHWLRLNLR